MQAYAILKEPPPLCMPTSGGGGTRRGGPVNPGPPLVGPSVPQVHIFR